MGDYIILALVLFSVFVVAFCINSLESKIKQSQTEIEELQGVLNTQRMLIKELSNDVRPLKYPPLSSSENSRWTIERSLTIDNTHKLVQMLMKELGYELQEVPAQPKQTKLVKVPF